MRVDLLTPVVSLHASQRATITLQVRNDSDVIEQIVCTMPKLDKKWYAVSPTALNLFPGELGELRITLELPRSFPAGVHKLEAFVTGRVRKQTLLQPVEVHVEPLFDPLLVVNPTTDHGPPAGTLPRDRAEPRQRAGGDGGARLGQRGALEFELDRPVLTHVARRDRPARHPAQRAGDHRAVRSWQAAVVRRAGLPHDRRHRRAPPRRAAPSG